MARGLHYSGCSVAILDKDHKSAEKLVMEINDDDGKAINCNLDSRKKPDFERSLALVLDTFGGVDILINGAGINAPTPFLEIPEDGTVFICFPVPQWNGIGKTFLGIGSFLGGFLFSGKVNGWKSFISERPVVTDREGV